MGHVWYRAALGLLLAALLGAGVRTARAAHEWRAAWSAPQPLWLVERLARQAGRPSRVEAAVTQPYGVPGVQFHALRLRADGGAWELHAGGLRAEPYREWHLGAARRLQLSSGLDLRLGARIFGHSAAGEAGPAIAALTLLAVVRPPGLRELQLCAGGIDIHGGHRPGSPASLLCFRAQVMRDSPGLILDHTVSPSGSAETTLGVSARFGPVRFTHVFRWSVGEGCLTLELRRRRMSVTLGQGWHPDLGWTPHLSVSWLEGAGADA